MTRAPVPMATGRNGAVSTWHRMRYEIPVQGVLGGRCTAWFEGLQVNSDGNQTVICGPVADQAPPCTGC